jgi:aminopeptidase N
MLKRIRRATIAAATFLLVAAGTAGAVNFTPGSAGLGDPYFPNAGNGGYEVSHYGLTLDYDQASNHLAGTAVISAQATQDLSRFDLDLRGFTISRLLVNGAAASHTRDGQELVITPAAGIPTGSTFTVTIDYAGTPQVVVDPDGSFEGWVPTDDGAYVVGEPQGSPAWYPVNDNPRDKATFDFSVTVPAGLTAMGNGVLVSNQTTGGKTTWVWRETDPMAPYLSTVTLGRFDLDISTTVGGIPSYVAIDPTLPSGNVFRKLPEIVQFYTSIYGPYPFNAVGSIADDAKIVGYSLETQTKPVYDRMPDETTVAHELSHMWFGDSVTLTTWPDIWLHEGFATWSEWIWSEHTGQKTAQKFFDNNYNVPAQQVWFWTPPPGDPGGPANMFNGTIYDRGAMTLQALRQKIGDDDFFRLLRTWATRNRYGNVSTSAFVVLAEQISGQQLDNFFDVWLYQPEKPTAW